MYTEAMKIEISQIPITDNLPPNLSRSERKRLSENLNVIIIMPLFYMASFNFVIFKCHKI